MPEGYSRWVTKAQFLSIHKTLQMRFPKEILESTSQKKFTLSQVLCPEFAEFFSRCKKT